MSKTYSKKQQFVRTQKSRLPLILSAVAADGMIIIDQAEVLNWHIRAL